MSKEHSFNVVASSDWHIRADQDKPRYLSVGQATELFQEMAHTGDVILYCGDFTDFDLYADEDEIKRSATTAAQIFGQSIKPKFAVLGNHDHSLGHNDYIQRTLEDLGGITMVQGKSYSLDHGERSVGFAGAKGLGGGFDQFLLSKFGEESNIHYREAIDKQSCDLQQALQASTADNIFVLTHYAPIRATIMSEGPERFHSLGNSGLEKAIDEFSDKIVVALHGHAHFGDPHGRTTKGVDVDNVALQVLQRTKQGDNTEFIPTNLFETYSLTR